ncbi:His/Gly/Thr/Pro-type tRNA ligase C-terminal domain-containing protein [Vallitalea maricola]
MVGQKEQDENKVAVRSRAKGDEGAISLDEFIARLEKEIESKEIIEAEEK